jgi:hypothetical protein
MADLSEPREMGFNERVLSLVRSLDQREPKGDAEKDEIYRLRFAAYQRAKMVTPDVPMIFKDQFDDAVNGKTLGIYLDGALAASIRIHVASQDIPVAPALKVYPDILWPLLNAGKIIVDPTRHVVKLHHAGMFPRLPYVTVRLAWMACEHYGADFVLATIPTHHKSFYRRIFGVGIETAPRSYPGIAVPVILLAWNYSKINYEVNARYPFLKSDERERISIFGGGSDPEKNREWLPGRSPKHIAS